MKCIHCGGTTKVIDSRTLDNGMRYRRRECMNCGRRFETRELPRGKARAILLQAATELQAQDKLLAIKLRGLL